MEATAKDRYIKTIIVVALIALCGYLLGSYLSVKSTPTELPKVNPIKLQSTTQLTTAPKTSATDNDLEVTQVYRANINGTQVEAPIITKGTDGTKGIIQQEIDMTPILQMQKALDKKEFKKNWEVSTGIGVHDKDVYIPIEIQRNYSKDKAISVEIHQDFKDLKKTTGAELKHSWMF